MAVFRSVARYVMGVLGAKISAGAGHFFRTAEAIHGNAPDEIRHELIISQTDRFRAPLEKCLVILPRVDEARRDRIDRYAKGSQFIGQTTAKPQSCRPDRSEEHTSEHQSLMRTSSAVFCLKKTNEKLTKSK